MQIIATQKNVRQSPRKVRLVANTVKDLSLTVALSQLAVMERRASLVVIKVLKQAIANAMNNHQLAYDALTLKSIEVTPGQTYKRWRAVSRGRAHSIMKRTSHIRVVLNAADDAQVQPVKAVETKKTDAAEKKPTKKASTPMTVNQSKVRKEAKPVTAKNTVAKRQSMSKGKTK
jgi:large subunit ribosomal protein L22